MNGVQRLMGRVRASMQAVSRAARRTLLVGTVAIAGLLRLQSIQIKAEAKLAAVLKATKNAAGLSVKQLKIQADQIQRLTGVGDEAVLAMQAVLATFTQIKGGIFIEATKAIIDMAAVLDTDLKGGAIQLGKALNDPIKGISALSRVGVAFTQTQKDTIRSFVEMGDVASAQKVILDELKNEFGDVAEALGNTLPGEAKKAAASIGDLGEKMGAVFAPAAITLFKAIVKVTDNLGVWIRENAKLVLSLVTTAATIATVTIAIPILAGTISVLSKSLVVLQVTLGLVRAKLALLPALITAINISITAAVASVGILIIQFVRMRTEIATIRKFLNEATTSLNEASAAGRELKEALKIEDFGAALDASKRKTEALKQALQELISQASKIEEGGTSFVFGDKEQEALLRNLHTQIIRINTQIRKSGDEEKRVNDLLIVRTKLEKEIADKKNISAAAAQKFTEDNASTLEGIRKTNQEIAVLRGEITQQQADFNELFAKGVDVAIAAAAVEARNIRSKIVEQQAAKKASKDKGIAIKKSLTAEADAIRESLLTDKQRQANDIARVRLLQRQGFLTKEETAEKIKQLLAQEKINKASRVLTAQALFRRIQESAGSRVKAGGTQAVLLQLSNSLQALTTQTDKRVVSSVDTFRESFERAIDNVSFTGHFGK